MREREGFALARALARAGLLGRDFFRAFVLAFVAFGRAREGFARFRDLGAFFVVRAFREDLAGLAAGSVEARAARAPMVPPTTVPTGPARLPIIAPAAAPATGLGIGGT